MLYEKPPVKPTIHSNLIGGAALLVVLTSFVTYGACLIYGVIKGCDPGQSISFLDLLNGAAQIATAATFTLALVQYRKNSAQQRHETISKEAIAQIEKATKIISEIQVGEESSFEQLNKSITLLSNIGSNIYELFNAMDEGVYKAIVRMHWQDMHFNHFRHIFPKIDGQAALRRELSTADSEFDMVIQAAKNKTDEEHPIAIFRDFVFLRNLFNQPAIKERISLKGKFESLDLFCFYYLNDFVANDLLYGTMSRIDIRAHAPLLAVAEPSTWALSRRKA